MDDDLIDLLAAWRGDDVGPQRRDELLARLRADEAFQQAFVEEIRLLGMLKAVQAPEPRWLRVHDELGWGRRAVTESGEFERRVLAALPRVRRRRWKAVAAVAAAAALLLAMGLLARGWRQDAPARPQARPRVDVETALALIVRLDAPRWDPEDGPPPGVGELLGPGRFRIRGGRATLSMLTGAVVVVEGPADLDLVSHERIFCREGRLRTRVPKGAEGLVIASRDSAVLDLGTEFGVNVEPGGRSAVKVFEGRAEAFLHKAEGNQGLSQFLRRGSSITIDPSAGRIAPSRGAESFADPADLPTPDLRLQPDYRDGVLASKPWGYWRFERLGADGAVPNEVPGGPPLRAHGAVRLAGPAEGNRCAEFPPGQAFQYFELDGLFQPTTRPGYAIELWFTADAVDHASLVSLPETRDTNLHAAFLELTSRNRHALHPPGTVRFLDRWPPATGGGYNLYAKRPYVPHRWHHLLGQMDAGRMELYLDGEPVYSVPTDRIHPSTPCQVLVGRLSTVRDTDWLYNRAFVGRIDEVALYDHSLPAAEVIRHARGAGPGPRP